MSSSEGEEIVTTDSPIDIEGFLKKREGEDVNKKGKSWNVKFVILSGSSIFIYNSQLKETPKTTLNFKGGKVLVDNDADKAKNAFAIEADGKLVCFTAKDEEEKKRWLAKINGNINAEPTSVPQRILAKKKGGAFFRASKNLSEGIASSSLGRKIIKEFAPEADDLLEDVKKSVELMTNKEKGKEFEGNVIKLSVKAHSLYQGKIVSDDEFASLKLPVLRVWNSFTDCESSFSRDLEFLALKMRELYQCAEKLFRPHLSPKTMALMSEITDFFCDIAHLELLFSDSPEYMKATENIFNTLKEAWKKIPPQDKKMILDDCLAQTSANAPQKESWTTV